MNHPPRPSRRLRTAAASFLLAAAFPLAAHGEPITAVRVEGLKRTRPAMVRRLLAEFEGVDAATLDKERVALVLLDTGLFEDVRVDANAEDGSGGRALQVTVSEKWSVIPVPAFAATADGITAGAAVIDANAFGLADTLVAVGLVLPTGWMASAAYVDSSADARSPRLSYSAYVSRQDRRVQDERSAELARWASSELDLSFSAEFPLLRGAGLSAGIAFRERAAEAADGSAFSPPPPGRAVAGKAGAFYRSTSWDGVFISEASAYLQASWSYGLEGASWPAAEFRSRWELPFVPGFRARLSAAGIWAPDSPAVFESDPFAAGTALLPGRFAAASLAGAEAGLELRALKLPFGSVSALASYQAAAARGSRVGDVLAYGPAAGLRLYIAKVAVPAVDVGAAWNLATGIPRFSFGIGMRM